MEEEYRERKADEYRERVHELEKEKAEIETTLSEMERSDVPQEQALKRVREVLARETSAGVQQAWRDKDASGQVKDTASVVYSRNLDDTGLQEADTLFPDSGGTSFAHQSGIGEGIEARVKSIASKFAEAVELNTREKPDPASVDTPTLKGPKLPG
jgi:hypothetical protein